jgi:hypothetical protein
MNAQRNQVLGLLGVLGSLLWLSLNTVLSPDWGPPGSTNYLGYETVNRLWAPAFALMLCGFVGLYQRYPLRRTRLGRVGFRLAVTGLVLMLAGNIAEFWLFSAQPYGELNGRNLAWIVVLLGMLSVLIGAGLFGLAGLRHASLPRWASGLFLLALPAALIFIVSVVELMSVPLVGAGLLAGALAAWPSAGALTAKGSSLP